MISLTEFITILLYGTALGGVLALMACGFTLIFGVSRILNFAHGAYFMLGAYFGIMVMGYLGLNPNLSGIIGIILVGVLALILYYLIVSHVRHNEPMAIIVTLALALIIENFIYLVYGEYGITYPSLLTGTVEIVGVPISYMRLLAILISIISLVLLSVFINKTRVGMEIVASSQDPEAAEMMGIDTNRILAITMFISAILAGLGGVLYAQIYSANPLFILKTLIFAFAIVILGGLGSIGGSIISSFIVGYILTAVIMFYGARWSEFISLLIIIIILIVRPYGLFGVKE